MLGHKKLQGEERLRCAKSRESPIIKTKIGKALVIELFFYLGVPLRQTLWPFNKFWAEFTPMSYIHKYAQLGLSLRWCFEVQRHMVRSCWLVLSSLLYGVHPAFEIFLWACPLLFLHHDLFPVALFTFKTSVWNFSHFKPFSIHVSHVIFTASLPHWLFSDGIPHFVFENHWLSLSCSPSW